jgi:hypothetical protein
MGNGEPGSHTWSSTDHDTCTLEPLGGVPEMVKWSAAVVITPKGWVGRVDNHITHRTIHLPVLPEVKPFHSEIDQLEPRCRTQEKTFEDWQGDAEQGDQETSFTPIGNYRLPFPRGVADVDTAFIEPYDQLVLDTAGYFSALDLERINWTRSDLLVWISDDLAQYRDDLQDFVVCERDHIRSLIGGY